MSCGEVLYACGPTVSVNCVGHVGSLFTTKKMLATPWACTALALSVSRTPALSLSGEVGSMSVTRGPFTMLTRTLLESCLPTESVT